MHHFDLRRFFQLIESELALNNRCFRHQEFQLGERRECLVTTPDCLHLDRSEDGAVWALELVSRILDRFINLDSVRDTRKDVLLRVLLVVEIRQLEQAHNINVGMIDCILAKELLNLLH